MILDSIDLNQTITEEDYGKALFDYQLRLWALGQRIWQAKRQVVIVFEGSDAAGKGGAIRRLTEKLDPRGYVAHGIAAPQGEDKTHHYLYRFWRRLPELGQVAIFDRSWYGRVLVERVEGFCSEDEWKRSYREINEFERQIVRFGAIVVKLWLQISKEEQLRRFRERADNPLKSWKLTDEDWRNRDKWDAYAAAVEEMLVKTSTATAPWTIVEANDKRFERVKVLRTVCERITEELDRKE
jgi:polyphosphate kinase 2 (PPK2 family)